MEPFTAIQRFVRITRPASATRSSVDPWSDAEQAPWSRLFTLLERCARIIEKVLASAIANAKHTRQARTENLYVKEARVGAGPTMKRWLPRARACDADSRRTSHAP